MEVKTVIKCSNAVDPKSNANHNTNSSNGWDCLQSDDSEFGCQKIARRECLKALSITHMFPKLETIHNPYVSQIREYP